MRKKQLHSILRALIAFCLILSFFIGANSCQKEEHGGNEQTFSERFFAYDGQVKLTESIIRYLRTRNDSVPFAEKFAEKYGMPMWKGAVDIYEEDATLLFVPVRNKELEEIETIWMFKIKGGRISYYPLKKEKLSDELKWGFDYFTQEVLMKKPKSGLSIRPIANDLNLPSTRVTIVTRHCNEIYTGNDKSGYNYQYTYCWNTYIDIPENPDNHNDPGSGGCRECMKEIGPEPDGGSGGYTPGTPEVIPDNSLDHPDYKNVKDIFDCIVMNAPSPFVKNMLNRFYGSDAEFDVTYKVGTMPAGYENAIGLCDFSGSEASGYKKGIITFNQNKLNTSSIELISTLLHETLHAYIHSYLYSKDPTLKKTTLDEAFNLYEEKLKQGATEEQEHNFMAATWIHTLTDELQKFHATQESYGRFWKVMGDRGFDTNNKSFFYEAMAWVGLKKTKAYKDLTSTHKAKMDSVYNYDNRQTISKDWTCK